MRIDSGIAVRRRRIDSALARYIPERSDTLSRAVRYSLFSGGKRLRSVLLLAAGESVGGSQRALLPFACGIEMIHTYSLVHDDLPAMDDDELRRGRPTSHRVFGEGMAILAGDALLTEAFRVMATARPLAGVPARTVIEAIHVLAMAAGMRGLVAGQAADSEHEGRSVSLVTVRQIHRQKTGALFEAAARAGALLGGANRTALGALTRYGRALGLALQIADDVRDATASTSVTGKNSRRDEVRGKATYAAVLGVNPARVALDLEISRAVRALRPLVGGAELLRRLAESVVTWGAQGMPDVRPGRDGPVRPRARAARPRLRDQSSRGKKRQK